MRWVGGGLGEDGGGTAAEPGGGAPELFVAAGAVFHDGFDEGVNEEDEGEDGEECCDDGLGLPVGKGGMGFGKENL